MMTGQQATGVDRQSVSLTRTELQALLITQCEQCGGVRAWARSHGIVPSLVSMTISGERAIGQTIANALGYFHVDVYVPMRSGAPARAVATGAAS